MSEERKADANNNIQQTSPEVPIKAKLAPANNPAIQKEEIKPKDPSPLEPLLVEWMAIFKEKFGSEAVKDGFVNQAGADLITIEINKNNWLETAIFLRQNEKFQLNYVRNYSAVDEETYFRIVLHLSSLKLDHQLCLQVHLERDQPDVASLSQIWKAANWNEREMFDLFGIKFLGHPDLKRILLPDNWVGYPLRKDYEPLDKEV